MSYPAEYLRETNIFEIIYNKQSQQTQSRFHVIAKLPCLCLYKFSKNFRTDVSNLSRFYFYKKYLGMALPEGFRQSFCQTKSIKYLMSKTCGKGGSLVVISQLNNTFY